MMKLTYKKTAPIRFIDLKVGDCFLAAVSASGNPFRVYMKTNLSPYHTNTVSLETGELYYFGPQEIVRNASIEATVTSE